MNVRAEARTLHRLSFSAACKAPIDYLCFHVRAKARTLRQSFFRRSSASNCSSALNSQRGLDGVVHVVAVDLLVDAHALLADGVQKSGGVAEANFANGGVFEHGVETADACREFLGRAASAGALDGLDGVADGVNAIANCVGKVAVEQQEFPSEIS